MMIYLCNPGFRIFVLHLTVTPLLRTTTFCHPGTCCARMGDTMWRIHQRIGFERSTGASCRQLYHPHCFSYNVTEWHKAWVIAMPVENPQSSGWFAPSPCNILSQPLAIIPQGSPIYEDYEDPMLNKWGFPAGRDYSHLRQRPTRSNGCVTLPISPHVCCKTNLPVWCYVLQCIT